MEVLIDVEAGMVVLSDATCKVSLTFEDLKLINGGVARACMQHDTGPESPKVG